LADPRHVIDHPEEPVCKPLSRVTWDLQGFDDALGASIHHHPHFSEALEINPFSDLRLDTEYPVGLDHQQEIERYAT
jgi:hypothetical protein